MTEKKTIVWLTTQFPNGKYNRNGIYIFSTVKFLSEYFDVHVLNIYSRTFPFLQIIKHPLHVAKIIKLRSKWFPRNPVSPDGTEGFKVKYIEYSRLLPRGKFDFLEKRYMYDEVREYIQKLIEDGKHPLIHSNWIFPESSIAYDLKKDLGCEYMISLRGGDIRELVKGTKNYFEAKEILQGATKIGAVTEMLFNEAEKKDIVIEKSKKFILDNYFDITIFNILDKDQIRRDLCIPNNSKLLFFAGTLRSLKNIDSLIKTVHTFFKDGYDVRLAVAGTGIEDYNLRNLAERLGVKERIIFLGNIDPETMGRYYNAADIFCLPSYSEGLPSVCVESLLCGTPVAASRINGIPEIIFDGINGYLFDPHSQTDIHNKIELALKKQWDREKLRQSVSRFMPEKILKEHIDFYSND